MAFLNGGARVAVGSLPHTDPSSAVRFQCHAFPEVPAWPQLPKRHPREGLTRQGMGGIPGLTWAPDGKALCQEPDGGWESLLERWAGDLQSGRLDGAALDREEAPGFYAFMEESSQFFSKVTQAVKGQCVGPVTLGRALRTREGRPLLENPVAMDALAAYLALHALWQCRRLSGLGKPVVFFLDEPLLRGTGPGQADPAPEDMERWFDRILGPLQEDGVLTGFHLCGAGPFTGALASSAECLHLDAYRFMETLSGDPTGLQHFVGQGGYLAFGLVPTAMHEGTFPEPAALVDRWMGFCYSCGRHGVDPDALVRQSLFSTACGLGGGVQAVAEEAGRCLSATTALWRIASGVEGTP